MREMNDKSRYREDEDEDMNTVMVEETEHPSKDESAGDAFEMLKSDHRYVKELFSSFEETDKNARPSLAAKALTALEIHGSLEEELIYPAVDEVIENQDMVKTAREVHHIAKLLIQDLKGIDVADTGFAVKFKLLGDIIEPHIEEEENEMFPQAVEANIDVEALTELATSRKEQLMQKYQKHEKAP